MEGGERGMRERRREKGEGVRERLRRFVLKGNTALGEPNWEQMRVCATHRARSVPAAQTSASLWWLASPRSPAHTGTL